MSILKHGHGDYVLQNSNQPFDTETNNLCFGEIIKYGSLDSTVGFVYNIVTSSGT